MVGADDLVYHLGDVIFARRFELKDILHDLPGIKIIIRGNHDYYDIGNKKRKVVGEPDFYINAGFVAIMEAVLERNFILLSHAPMLLSNDIKMNIHGHFHDNYHRSYEPYLMDSITKGKDRHRLLAVEFEGYKPVLLDEFIGRG
jgi:calcineurin-like phosphoesterase family protein